MSRDLMRHLRIHRCFEQHATSGAGEENREGVKGGKKKENREGVKGGKNQKKKSKVQNRAPASGGSIRELAQQMRSTTGYAMPNCNAPDTWGDPRPGPDGEQPNLPPGPNLGAGEPGVGVPSRMPVNQSRKPE